VLGIFLAAAITQTVYETWAIHGMDSIMLVRMND
jgi:hypothetical protein